MTGDSKRPRAALPPIVSCDSVESCLLLQIYFKVPIEKSGDFEKVYENIYELYAA